MEEEKSNTREVAIDIEKNTLVCSIRQRLDVFAGGEPDDHEEPVTIFRVPAHIREADRIHYEPTIVSIGPYHRGAGHLRTMEEHKWKHLRDFLSRRAAKQYCLPDYVAAMQALEPRARRCYSESVALDAGEFAEMLLLDGCFIMESLLKLFYNEPDSMCRVSWIEALVRTDLLMLENQIPFFVLQTLFDMLVPSGFFHLVDDEKMICLNNLVFEFLIQDRFDYPAAISGEDCLHLLHFYHSSFLLHPHSENPLVGSSHLRSTRRACPRTIPCAAALREAGVKFKKKKKRDANCFIDITFRHGVLEIPFLMIEESRTSPFVNLIAFEQCYRLHGKRFTSYAIFMDCLVSTPADVSILRHYGIIENRLANDEAAATFFNRVCDIAYLDYEDHLLLELFKEVRGYYDSKWLRWRARLVRDYFSNPWAILSVMAAVVLLLLTVVQSFFAAYSYFRPP